MEVNGLGFTGKVKTAKKENIKEKKLLKQEKADSFEKTKKDKSNNNKLDGSEIAKNFFKGVISPITAAIKHPFITAGIIGATALACYAVPVLGSAMTVGFLGVSIFQLGKGGYNVIKNIKNKEYDNAEKSFQTVGQGAIGTALGILGIKQGAKAASEAKAMQKLGTKTLTHTEREKVATEISGNSFIKNLKEIFSLVTTKEGRKAAISEFKPSFIKQRFKDGLQRFKGLKEEEKIEHIKRKRTIEDFKNSAEGKRRAAMSDEEIEAEVNNLFDKAFDELKIPKEQRPKLQIKKGLEMEGGSYSQRKHTINYNPESYKAGVFEMDDVIMHEATHCKGALLRAGIPQDRVNAIVRDELISRIQNGESEQIVVKGNFFGADMMEPPKLSNKMKTDFIDFAKQDLYVKNNDQNLNIMSRYTDGVKSVELGSKYMTKSEFANIKQEALPILNKLKDLIAKNPEFKNQFANEEEAINALMKYSLSHGTRYKTFTDTSITSNFTKLQIPELTGEELLNAEKSLVDSITTIEGNARIGGFNGWFAGKEGFNQYQFSPEEVLAQKNGNEFLIKNLTAKLNEMRANGTLTAEDEALLNRAIQKANSVIEYKTKGLEYYEEYTKLINNPNDKNLQQSVKMLEETLSKLKDTLNEADMEVFEEVTKVKVPTDHLSAAIPASAIYELISSLKEN